MYYDFNSYLRNQHCEYCGEMLQMFEKIIFPKKCKNNDQSGMPNNAFVTSSAKARKVKISGEDIPFTLAVDEGNKKNETG
mmetsp:Transcript_3927/g.4675  ORF Transcript_3927/g.4675 Transcript_3927/m.4675 type:complete len:80 (+) Transcript_3927:1797-2036(+)